MDGNTTLWESESTNPLNTTLPPIIHQFPKNNPLYCVVFVGVACLIVDFWAVYVIRKKPGPPSHYSLLNLLFSSVLVVLSTVLTILKIFGHLAFLDGWGWCAAWGVLTRFHVSIFPFTMVGIFYEMIHAQAVADKTAAGTWFKLRIFSSVWVAAVVLSLPGLGTYGLRQVAGSSRCKRILLLNSEVLFILYDGIFTSCVTILPVWFMIYALHRVNFKIKLLCFCKPIPFGLNGMVWRIRLVFFYVIFFAACCIPTAGTYLLKLTGHMEWRGGSYTDDGRYNLVFVNFRWITFLAVALQPLLFLCSNEKHILREMQQKLPLISRLFPNLKEKIRKKVGEISSAMKMETFAVTGQQIQKVRVEESQV